MSTIVAGSGGPGPAMPHGSPKRAALYTRISEDDGKALGVARQEKDARAEAKRRGWDVVAVYSDNDVSATRSKRRPEYERLLTDVRAGLVNAIVIWDADRLTRTPREAEDLIELVDTTGLALANVTGSEDLSTSDGRLVFRIKVAVARREVEQMSKRLKRKFQERAEAGMPHGRVPYGFRRVDGRDVADPTEAAVVCEAAERVLRGDSLRSIAMDFTARGIPGPTVPNWSSAILRQILKRPTLAGLRQYRGAVIGDAVSDAIITPETHERLVALLTDPSRRSNKAGSEHKYLLSGIARCGLCGGPMRRSVGRITTSTSGGQRRQPPAYTCSVCFKVRRKQQDVDDVVLKRLLAYLAKPETASLFQTGDKVLALEAEQRLQEIDRLLGELMEDRVAGAITREQLLRGTARLNTERDVVARRRNAALPTSLAQLDFANVAESFAGQPIAVQRDILDLVTTITILPSGPGRSFDPDLIVTPFEKAAEA